jgi:DNA-nicking Smr family endonuclease
MSHRFRDAGEPESELEPVPIDIDGELDLHSFSPREIKHLVPDYLEACQQAGILDVRVVHGKGKGHLQRSVHALLERSPLVASYRLGREGEGSWGATVVRLHPPR